MITLLRPPLHSSVGSFYAIHFVANMLVAVAAVLYSCESSGFYAMFLFIYLGVSVVSVNILGHRWCAQDNTPLSGLGPVNFAFLGAGTLVAIPGT
jgi:hypothetical protein